MKIDWNAIKNNKVLKWAIIIGAPTVLVAGYYGFKYIQKKKFERDSAVIGEEIKEEVTPIEIDIKKDEEK